MKSFFSVRRTRYTAAVMLFVWLMSLGIGVANACLLQSDHGADKYFSRSNSATIPAALAGQDLAPVHIATSSVHSDENISSPEKITCLKFCVAEQNTLVKHHADGLAGLDIVPVLFLTWLLVPAVDQAFQPEAFGSPTRSEPPVSIRYLRLNI
jgi:hypothetical protein